MSDKVPSGFMSQQPDYLKFIYNLGLGTIAILLLGGVLYLQHEEREADTIRAAEDRKALIAVVTRNLDAADSHRTTNEERTARFVEQQAQLIEVIRQQKDILKRIDAREERRVELMRAAVREENRKLLEVISVPLKERRKVMKTQKSSE